MLIYADTGKYPNNIRFISTISPSPDDIEATFKRLPLRLAVSHTGSAAIILKKNQHFMIVYAPCLTIYINVCISCVCSQIYISLYCAHMDSYVVALCTLDDGEFQHHSSSNISNFNKTFFICYYTITDSNIRTI